MKNTGVNDNLGTIKDDSQLVKIINDAIADKKGINTKILDISRISSIADYFIITSGSNENQIRAIADSIDNAMNREKRDIKSREGFKNAGWVLMDYGNIVVHIFSGDDREFYDLERIWSDGISVEVS